MLPPSTLGQYTNAHLEAPLPGDPTDATTGTSPPVSVVIPVRDEAEAVQAAVASALAQEYDGPLEVVVADGMSTDGTRDVLSELAARHNAVRWVDNPARTTPAGLNAAIRASSGEVIVRLDAHARLPAGYIRRAVELLAETGADNVGGIQAATGEGVIQRAIALAMSIPLGVGDARFHYGGAAGPTDTVYMGVFRRDAFDRVGLFDETLIRNQDYELNYRIRRGGGVVYFDPGLRVQYSPRRSLGALWSQYRQYGTWKREVLRRHPRSLRWRQLLPPSLVAGLVGSVALAVLGFRWALVVPLVYAGIIVAAAAWYTVTRRDLASLALALTLPTMHLAWGIGFLFGRTTRGGLTP